MELSKLKKVNLRGKTCKVCEPCFYDQVDPNYDHHFLLESCIVLTFESVRVCVYLYKHRILLIFISKIHH